MNDDEIDGSTIYITVFIEKKMFFFCKKKTYKKEKIVQTVACLLAALRD